MFDELAALIARYPPVQLHNDLHDILDTIESATDEVVLGVFSWVRGAAADMGVSMPDLLPEQVEAISAAQ